MIKQITLNQNQHDKLINILGTGEISNILSYSDQEISSWCDINIFQSVLNRLELLKTVDIDQTGIYAVDFGIDRYNNGLIVFKDGSNNLFKIQFLNPNGNEQSNHH